VRRYWHEGNRIELLENGEEFFPRVFEAIRNAKREVFLQTFILGEDKVGRELREVLIDASSRGVQANILVDGYGSHGLTNEFTDGLKNAGVQFHIFNPAPDILGFRINVLRRMHRKLVAIDGDLAYIGGINFCADHLSDFGPEAKQDYAVEIQGAAAMEIREFCLRSVAEPSRSWSIRFYERHLRRRKLGAADKDPMPAESFSARVLFVTRDNHRQRTAIEKYYRVAMRAARKELIIANAYFFPGYRLLRSLHGASQRGVNVILILQGQPDMPIVKWAAGLLYEYLLSGGVKIYEYCERPFHGKVAVMDNRWATVGSSNLDPLSLALNLEANVVIEDDVFNEQLRQRLHRLIKSHCRLIHTEKIPRHKWWHGVVSATAFHLLRLLPAWAELLPKQTVTLKKI
jgi:cardiolipin synthase A/B